MKYDDQAINKLKVRLDSMNAEVKQQRAAASKRYRDSRLQSGVKEIRNCYIKPEHEQALRDYAAKLNA